MMNDGFQRTLDHIRAIAESEAHKGRLFVRLMKTYFTKDPIYRERFSAVWLWSEWAIERPDFDGTDTGIDLVAEERDGRGYCAIQCKCYAPGTRISKPQEVACVGGRTLYLVPSIALFAQAMRGADLREVMGCDRAGELPGC